MRSSSSSSSLPESDIAGRELQPATRRKAKVRGWTTTCIPPLRRKAKVKPHAGWPGLGAGFTLPLRRCRGYPLAGSVGPRAQLSARARRVSPRRLHLTNQTVCRRPFLLQKRAWLANPSVCPARNSKAGFISQRCSLRWRSAPAA
jgi:hypothetical protein